MFRRIDDNFMMAVRGRDDRIEIAYGAGLPINLVVLFPQDIRQHCFVAGTKGAGFLRFGLVVISGDHVGPVLSVGSVDHFPAG